MSSNNFLSTSQAAPEEVTAHSSPSSSAARAADSLRFLTANYPTADLGDRWASARNRAPRPSPARMFQPHMAVNMPPPHLQARPPSGNYVRSSAGFRSNAVPGNYRGAYDYNMGPPQLGHVARPIPQQTYAAPSLPVAAPGASQIQAATAPVPVAARQVQAIIPPPGVSSNPLLALSRY